MKKLVAVLFLVALTTACATAGYPMQQAGPMYPPPMYRPPMYGPTVQPGFQAPVPVGRWDNVMMLAAGTPLRVLMMDGGLASGTVERVDSTSLSLRVASGEVELASTRVMRVDRLSSTDSAVKDGKKGAALGAGVVGVMGLIAGRVPPARLFAAGGIIGAYNNVELGAMTRRSVTIYLAPAVVPNEPAAAQSGPNAVAHRR